MEKKPVVLLLGVGIFGTSWAKDVLLKCGEYCNFAAAVDRIEDNMSFLPPEVRRYTDLDEALSEVKPDLVINVTPPHLHTELNLKLLSMGYPVVCEKPLAQDVEEAENLLDYYLKNGGFLMISDNYRYSPVFRECRRIISQKEYGDIRSVRCHFSHYHPDATNHYHGKLSQPLLLDVSVHHLDVARYLIGEEAIETMCETWDSPKTWYASRAATAALHTQMTGDVMFHYYGTLAAPAGTTDWNGDWEIECDRATLQVHNSQLYIYDQHEGEAKLVFPTTTLSDSRIPVLIEAIDAVRSGRKGETDLTDNIKTYRWLHDCILSSEAHKPIRSKNN